MSVPIPMLQLGFATGALSANNDALTVTGLSNLGQVAVQFNTATTYNGNTNSGFERGIAAAMGNAVFNVPTNYVIEGYNGSTWTALATITGNTYLVRGHVVNAAGMSQLRIRLTAAAYNGNANFHTDFSVHDASFGVEDWMLVIGDSVCEIVWSGNDYTGQLGYTYNRIDKRRFPLIAPGGCSGSRISDWSTNFAQYLADFPGKYVNLSIGHNDLAGGANVNTIGTALRGLVAAVLAANKVPIIPANLRYGTTGINYAGWAPVVAAIVADPTYGGIPILGPNMYTRSSLATSGTYMSDAIHPTDAGAEITREDWRAWAALWLYNPLRGLVPDTSRTTLWMPGIEGGIPDSSKFTVYSTVTLTAGSGAAAANTTAITTALSSAAAVATKASPRVVLLPAGTWYVNSFQHDYEFVVLKGNGPRVNDAGSGGVGTRLICNQANTDFITLGGSSTYTAIVVATSATGGFADIIKGTSRFTAAAGHGIQAADMIVIDLDNSDGDTVPGGGSWYMRNGADGTLQNYPAGSGVTGGVRYKTQTCTVKSVNGNVIEIDGLLHDAHLSSNHPAVYRNSSNRPGYRGVALEEMTITGWGDSIGVTCFAINRGWMKNVEFDGRPSSQNATWGPFGPGVGTGTQGVDLRLVGCCRMNIEGCYLHHSRVYVTNQEAYSISLCEQSSDCLVQNNIIWFKNKNLVGESCGAGNVAAYNYCDDPVLANSGSTVSDWFEACMDGTHVPCPNWTLMEGNFASKLGAADTHGNAADQTLFRNYGFGDRHLGDSLNGYSVATMQIMLGMRRFNAIGNVLTVRGAGSGSTYAPNWNASTNMSTNAGTPHIWGLGQSDGNWDGPRDPTVEAQLIRAVNFDYVRNQLDSTLPAGITLPTSAFLLTKPSFFGNLTWPAVDPLGVKGVSQIFTSPAQLRWDAGTPFAAAPTGGAVYEIAATTTASDAEAARASYTSGTAATTQATDGYVAMRLVPEILESSQAVDVMAAARFATGTISESSQASESGYGSKYLPTLVLDPGLPVRTQAGNVNALTVASPAFSTQGPSLIVVAVRNYAAGNYTSAPSSVTGSTLGALSPGPAGNDAWAGNGGFFIKQSNGPLTNEVITVNWANNQNFRTVTVYSFSGAAATQNGKTLSVSWGPVFPNVLTVTGTAVGSFLLGVLDNSWSGTITAGAGTTVDETDAHGGTMHSTITGGGGTMSLVTTTPATGAGDYFGAAIEILAAVTPVTGNTYTGTIVESAQSFDQVGSILRKGASLSEAPRAVDPNNACVATTKSFSETSQASDSFDSSSMILCSLSEGSQAVDGAAGGTAFALSQAEASQASEATALTTAGALRLAEAAQATDAGIGSEAILSVLLEQSQASDAQLAVATFTGAVSESSQTTDALGLTSAYDNDFIETSRAADLLFFSVASQTSRSDVVTSGAVESESARVKFTQGISEAPSAAGAADAGVSTKRTVSESSQAADQLLAGIAKSASISESSQASDLEAGSYAITIVLGETSQATDSSTGFGSYDVGLSEGSRASDALGNLIGLTVIISEVSGAGDALTALELFSSTLSESAQADDSFLSLEKYGTLLTETSQGTDSIIGETPFGNTYYDGVLSSSSASDGLGNARGTIVSLSEASSATDRLRVADILGAALSESSSGKDSIGHATRYGATMLEAPTSLDAAATAAAMTASQSESSSASDAWAQYAKMAVALLESSVTSESEANQARFVVAIAEASQASEDETNARIALQLFAGTVVEASVADDPVSTSVRSTQSSSEASSAGESVGATVTSISAWSEASQATDSPAAVAAISSLLVEAAQPDTPLASGQRILATQGETSPSTFSVGGAVRLLATGAESSAALDSFSAVRLGMEISVSLTETSRSSDALDSTRSGAADVSEAASVADALDNTTSVNAVLAETINLRDSYSRAGEKITVLVPEDFVVLRFPFLCSGLAKKGATVKIFNGKTMQQLAQVDADGVTGAWSAMVTHE